ncbi:MAG: hypothetical protein IIT72_03660 [Lachnospiraceae bacterium]|nr:hypothetical protein [Lachnospiraceae bacterium]MBQ5484562.1 hypothetical protein [Lachnospiraceae bacterium]
MKEVIQEYGQAILNVTAFSMVLVLLFGACCYWGKLARAAELCDKSLLKEEGNAADRATGKVLDLREGNVRMESSLFAVCGEKYFYNSRQQKLLRIRGKVPKAMAVLAVHYCNREKEWDVTGQTRFLDREREDRSYLCFPRSGCYRLTVYTDEDSGIQETWNIFLNVHRKRHRKETG